MTEPSEMLSVFDIAKRLGLHVKTVRNYVREGRLKAVRIGKQYRISRADLEEFAGIPLPATESELAKRQRAVTTSSVVQIDAMSPESAAQLDKSLLAYVHGQATGGHPLRVETIYDRDIGHLKIVLFGSPAAMAAVLKFIAAFIEN